MTSRLAVWNTQARLADPAFSDRVVEKILSLNADVVAIPEAFNKVDEQFDTLGTAMERMQDEGYEYYLQANDDTDGRADQRGIAVLNRIPAGEPYTINMLTRSAIGWSFKDPDDNTYHNIAAVHFDDRTEASRVAQAEVIADIAQGIYVNLSEAILENCPDADWVVLGDINSPRRSDPGARLLHALRPIAVRVPRGISSQEKNKIRRLGRIMHCGAQAANGGAIETLEATGLRDADPRHRTTSRLVPFALDHIMYSPSMRAHDFSRQKMPKELSDHHAISVSLEASEVY